MLPRIIPLFLLCYGIFGTYNYNRQDDNILNFYNASLKLLKRTDRYVLVGGRDTLYNISLKPLRVQQSRQIVWKTPPDVRKECEMIEGIDCSNFIRVYYELIDGFVICGTYGLRPTCAHYLHESQTPKDYFSGEGLSPVLPSVPFAFLSSGEDIYAVNSPEFSELSTAILIRKRRGANITRTARGESAFEAADIVAMVDNDKEVLTFFTEFASDADQCGSHRRMARVARVCKDDPGAMRHDEEWSSFVKANIQCGDSQVFSKLGAFVETARSYYGIFYSSLASVQLTVVCEFDRKTISTILASPFKIQNGSCARAQNEREQQLFRSRPLIHKKIEAEPLIVLTDTTNITTAAVHENYIDVIGGRYDLLYLANDTSVVKVKITVDRKKRDARRITTFPAESDSPVRSMWVVKQKGINNKSENRLFFLTANRVYYKNTSNCADAGKDCDKCLAPGDPECAWLKGRGSCVVHSHFPSESLEQSSSICNKRNDLKELHATPECLCTQKLCKSEIIVQTSTMPLSCPTNWEFQHFAAIIAAFLVGISVSNIFDYFSQKMKSKHIKGPPIPSGPPYRAYSDQLSTSRTSMMQASVHTYC